MDAPRLADVVAHGPQVAQKPRPYPGIDDRYRVVDFRVRDFKTADR